MKHSFYVLSAMILLIAGCGIKTSGEDYIYIDVKSQYPLSDFFESYEIIPLEMSLTEDNIIGNVDKITISDGKIYVMDRNRKVIFIFSDQGRYLSKIDRMGRGPEEYLDLQDFDLYESNIYMLSRTNQAMYVYDYKGNFINKYELGEWYNNLKVVDDHTVFLYSERSNSTKYNFIVYDYAKGRIVNEFDPFVQNRSYGFSCSPFNLTQDNEVLITQQFDHTVFNLTEESFTPRFSFVFNTADQIPEKQRRMNYDELSRDLRDKFVVKRITHTDQKDSMLFMTYSTYFPDAGLRNSMAVINLHTDEVKSVRLGDDFDPAFPFTGNVLSIQHGSLICSYSSLDVINIAKFHGFDISSYDIQEDGNPVIFKYRFK